MTYSFDGVTLPFVQSAMVPLASRIASVDTPARAGSYIGIRRAAARTATVVGTLKSSNFEALKADWAALQAAHDVDTPRPLIVREGWFYYALPDSLTESDVETSNLHYQADYKLGDPYCYSTTLSTHALAPSGTTSFPVGGKRPAKPTLTLVVSTIGTNGSITIQNSTTGQTCVLYPSSAQTYTINCRTEKMETGAAGDFSGVWLSLAPNATNTLLVTTAGGAALSSASTASWRDTEL